MGTFSGPNVALVLATCLRNGKADVAQQVLFYDDDLGWFLNEPHEENGTVRIWNKSGYHEIISPSLPGKQ